LVEGLAALVMGAFLMALVVGFCDGGIGAELGISIATVIRQLNKAALRCYLAL
ncbi:RNA polymerase subunit sigma, partial [Pseudomonas syringae pv. tagetis]